MSIFFSLMAHSLIIMCLCLMLLRVKRWGKYWPIGYVISAIIMVMPIKDWLVIEFSRGLLGDLSFASLLMLGSYLLTIMKKNRASNASSFNLLVIIMAVVLYPTSLGYSHFDMYSIGFASDEAYKYLVTVIAAIGIIAWYVGYAQIAIWLTLSLLAHGLGLFESNNLWNYLLDPLVVIACFISVIIKAAKLALKKSKSRAHHGGSNVQSNA
ncbi:MAG: hypothetical protein V7785_09400 [Bermanella sp.]